MANENGELDFKSGSSMLTEMFPLLDKKHEGHRGNNLYQVMSFYSKEKLDGPKKGRVAYCYLDLVWACFAQIGKLYHTKKQDN